MGIVPTLGTNLCSKDRSPSLLHTFQPGDQSESEPMEKTCIVQECVSESESDNGNKPLGLRVGSHCIFSDNDAKNGWIIHNHYDVIFRHIRRTHRI